MLDSSSFDISEQPFAFDEVQELVHHGATSVSYKVRIHNKWHFLKRPKPEFAHNPLYVAAFKKEFDLGYILDHPHIVRYISKGSDGEGIYILTEFVDGMTLTDYIKSNPDFSKNRKEVKRLLLQLCEALHYLHSHNIVHYDLKSDNILVTRNGNNVKLIDLGFSYSDCYDAIRCGTKSYSSPEQFSAPEKCDLRSDIYSLGRVIEFIFQEGKPIHKFKKICNKATQSDLSRRYATVDEIIRTINSNERKWIGLTALFVAILFVGGVYFFRNEPIEEYAEKPVAAPFIQTDTIRIEVHEIKTIPAKQPSAEEQAVASFQKELSRRHSKYFSVYYNRLSKITSQDEWMTALDLCGVAFNGSRAAEDSLLTVYINKYPSLERQLRAIAEEEMWASMSKHLSMQREYINTLNSSD